MHKMHAEALRAFLVFAAVGESKTWYTAIGVNDHLEFSGGDFMKANNRILIWIWWVYIILLFLFVELKFRGSLYVLSEKIATTPFGSNYNLIPFKSIGEQLSNISAGWAKYNLLGNTIPFIPFGYLMPMVNKRVNTLEKTALIGLAYILFFESIQFLTLYSLKCK